MLHVETDNDGVQVFIHADQQRVQKLRQVLDFIESKPEAAEHDHLFTPAWAGSELDEKLSLGEPDGSSRSNRTVHHVKLYYWPTVSAQP
jgi:hypothetical protein